MTLSRKLILVLMCIALILPTAVITAVADSNICVVSDNTEQLSTTVNEDGLTVFGYFGGKGGYPVTVTVKNAETGIDACLKQTMTESLGYYSVRFPYDASMLGNSYVITVRCIAEQNLYQKTVAYLPGTDTNTLLITLEEVAQESGGYTMRDFVREFGQDAGVSYALIEGLADSDSAYRELESHEYESLADFQKSFRSVVKNGVQESANVRTIHVATDGDNSNDGSIQSPMKTLSNALTYVDFLIKTGSKENFEIVLHGGQYQVTSDIVIEKKESRPNHITIKNYNDEKVVLDGTQNISGWEPYRNNIYRARVPMDVRIDVLCENGQMLTKARYPNKQASAENMKDEYLTTESYNHSKSQFLYQTGDLPSFQSIHDLEVAIFPSGPQDYYMWQMGVIGVKEIEKATRLVTLDSNAHYEIGANSYYYWQGALELLDAPGEFYHDTEGGYIYYYPTDGNFEGKTVSYPLVDNLITIANKDGSKISNVTVRGVELCGAKRNAQAHLNNRPGGNAHGNGIFINNAQNIAVMDCDIHAMGGNAIGVENGISDSVFSGNHIYYNGEAGIIVPVAANQTIKNNIIDNNYIHHMGQIIHSDSGIELTASVAGAHIDGNIISHNRLHDLPRCGIFIGRADGNNTIEYNDISATCNGSDDSGMIYAMLTTGITKISNNYIHDSYSMGSYRGIYLDEGAHNTIVENNLLTRLEGQCYALICGKGDDIQIVNNYFVNNPNLRDSVITSMTRYETTERMVIERNIIYNCGDRLYYHYNTDLSTNRLASSDKNLLYNPNGVYKANYGSQEYVLSLYQMFKQYEKNSKTADPQLLGSMAGNDVRFACTSPAKDLGIEPIDLEHMGLRENFIYADADKTPGVVFAKDETAPFATGTVVVGVGRTIQLESLVRNTKGFVIPAEEINFTYSAQEPAGVISLRADGTVSGIQEGTVRAKVTARTSSGTIEGEFDIAVLSGEQTDFKVTVNDIVVKNAGGTTLSALEAGELHVTVSLTSKQDTDVKMFLSYIGKTAGMNRYGVAEEANLTKNVSSTVSGTVTIPENPDGDLYLFVWNDAEKLQPLYRRINVFHE